MLSLLEDYYELIRFIQESRSTVLEIIFAFFWCFLADNCARLDLAFEFLLEYITKKLQRVQFYICERKVLASFKLPKKNKKNAGSFLTYQIFQNYEGVCSKNKGVLNKNQIFRIARSKLKLVKWQKYWFSPKMFEYLFCNLLYFDVNLNIECDSPINKSDYLSIQHQMSKYQQQQNRTVVHKAQLQEEYYSDHLRSKNIASAVILTLLQILFAFIYGFLFSCPPSLINVSSVITAIGLAILIIGGFGLVFGYTRRLVWSGIGFNFFIFVLCLEAYPIANDFWTRTQIQNQNNPLLNFGYDNRNYNLFLSNRETNPTNPSVNLTLYGNCITNAMKCALAVVVAFSSILGKASQLECIIVTILGVIGFELNRQCIQERIGSDGFGTFFIFTFGGFMGLGLGFLESMREKKAENTENQVSLNKYTSCQESGLYALFGSLLIFTFMPFLAYEIDGYIYFSNFATYSMPTCILLGMGAGVIASIIFSLIFNGELIIRDAIHGVIAGAIVAGASSLYVANPSYALIAGGVGGLAQSIIQNIFERWGINKRSKLSTVSWALFGFQGILGGAFAAGWKQVATNYWSSNFTGPVLTNFGQQFEFYAALVSAGFGLAFGLLAGLIIYCTNGQLGGQYYEDYYYWKSWDFIRTVKIEPKVEKKPQPVAMIPIVVAEPPKEQTIQNEIRFSQGDEQEVNNRHAYL